MLDIQRLHEVFELKRSKKTIARRVGKTTVELSEVIGNIEIKFLDKDQSPILVICDDIAGIMNAMDIFKNMLVDMNISFNRKSVESIEVLNTLVKFKIVSWEVKRGMQAKYNVFYIS